MKKSLSLILAIIMLASLLSACGGGDSGSQTAPAADSAAPQSSGSPAQTDAPSGDSGGAAVAEAWTLNVGAPEPPETFDPCISTMGQGIQLVFDTILGRDPDTMEVVPELASSWEWIDDYTLKLTFRDDVYFSNGEKMTPDDALYSLMRFVDNDQFLSDAGYDNISFDESYIDGSDLYLVMYETSPLMESYLANGRWAAVVCKSWAESCSAEDWWSNPVGAGPYVCVENVSGSHSSYKIRDDYWRELPGPASEINIFYYSEATTMFIDLESGGIDVAVNVGNNDAQRLIDSGSDALKYDLLSPYTFDWLALPEYTPEFDDIRVRQAMAYALDVEALTKLVYGGMASPADSCLIAGQDYYISQGVHEYNPDKARELLAEAGYSDGDLSFNCVVFNFANYTAMAEGIQAYLADIGVELIVESYDMATCIPIYMSNGTAVAIGGTGGGTFDAAMVMNNGMITTTNGTVRISDEEFNEYLTLGKYSLDHSVRAEAYKNAQEWMVENCRWIPISYPLAMTAYQQHIQKVPALDYKTPYLKYVTKTA